MSRSRHRDDPLSSGEREEFEDDLISFSDRELDELGDLRGLDVLYAGGTSPLWLEGLADRIGGEGTLTALDLDEERIAAARLALEGADLPAPVNLVVGDVFGPPFPPGSFDLVYSAGLFHELDVSERPAEEALAALASVVRPGGRVATSDFVDSVPAVQLEDEAIQAGLARETGGRLYGVGPPERLVAMHEGLLADVRRRVRAPRPIRHLDKLVLAEEETAASPELRERYEALRDRVRREGYTRPATLYVEGVVPPG